MPKTQKSTKLPVNPVKFQDFCSDFYDLYDKQKYLNIIQLFDQFSNSNNYDEMCFKYFNYVVGITILTAISYCNIGDYKNAKDILVFLEDTYYIFKRYYYLLIQILRRHYFINISQEDAKELVKHINKTLQEFNKHLRLRFYNNLAYVHYKNELYKDAIRYYKKTLPYAPNNVQIIVGYYQAIYYSQPKHCVQGEYKKTLEIAIKQILSLEANFDTYLALGKLHYFLGEHQKALNFINIAINVLKQDDLKNLKEIYAYDWISRIAYKQKQYSTASVFYEKIIDSLVKEQGRNFIDHEAIHPKPELYKMLKFLNETKQLIANQETSKLNKSIWSGIIITSIFGVIQFHYEQHFDMVHCFYLLLGIFLISCIIIRAEIKFFDFIQKYFPTYYKLIALLFSRLK